MINENTILSATLRTFITSYQAILRAAVFTGVLSLYLGNKTGAWKGYDAAMILSITLFLSIPSRNILRSGASSLFAFGLSQVVCGCSPGFSYIKAHALYYLLSAHKMYLSWRGPRDIIEKRFHWEVRSMDIIMESIDVYPHAFLLALSLSDGNPTSGLVSFLCVVMYLPLAISKDLDYYQAEQYQETHSFFRKGGKWGDYCARITFSRVIECVNQVVFFERACKEMSIKRMIQFDSLPLSSQVKWPFLFAEGEEFVVWDRTVGEHSLFQETRAASPRAITELKLDDKWYTNPPLC